MKSPFPGMDPYIEQCNLWGDFHHDLITGIKRALARIAPERYLVRAAERSYLVLVESEGKKDHPFLPDISVTTSRRPKKAPRKGGMALKEPTDETEPVTMRAFVEEEHREAFVEIFEATPEQRLVTSIEVLSPSNKEAGSAGRDLYLRKRQAHLLEAVNLVEIDLLRGGQRMPMLDTWPDTPYTILVARARKAHACKVWPVHYRRPLPTIPVPLAKPDPDVPLSLQPIVDEIYEVSRYAQTVDYSRPLKPPLGADDSAWLEQQLRARK